MLQLAASAERRSEHPLAHGIVLVGKRSLIEWRGLPIPPEIEATAHDLAERGQTESRKGWLKFSKCSGHEPHLSGKWRVGSSRIGPDKASG